MVAAPKRTTPIQATAQQSWSWSMSAEFRWTNARNAAMRPISAGVI
jgi:hypothetical protein